MSFLRGSHPARARDDPDPARERTSRVEHARAAAIGERVPDRREACLETPLRVTRRRGETVAAISGQPEDAERTLGRPAHDRPRGRDPFLRRTDAPRAGHGGHRLEQESRTEDDRECPSTDLSEPEGLEPEGSGERGEAESDQARHRDGGQRGVGRGVRHAEGEVVRRGEPGKDQTRPPGNGGSRRGATKLAPDEAQTQGGRDRKESSDRPRPRPWSERQPRQANRLGRPDQRGERPTAVGEQRRDEREEEYRGAHGSGRGQKQPPAPGGARKHTEDDQDGDREQDPRVGGGTHRERDGRSGDESRHPPERLLVGERGLDPFRRRGQHRERDEQPQPALRERPERERSEPVRCGGQDRRSRADERADRRAVHQDRSQGRSREQDRLLRELRIAERCQRDRSEGTDDGTRCERSSHGRRSHGRGQLREQVPHLRGKRRERSADQRLRSDAAREPRPRPRSPPGTTRRSPDGSPPTMRSGHGVVAGSVHPRRLARSRAALPGSVRPSRTIGASADRWTP